MFFLGYKQICITHYINNYKSSKVKLYNDLKSHTWKSSNFHKNTVLAASELRKEGWNKHTLCGGAGSSAEIKECKRKEKGSGYFFCIHNKNEKWYVHGCGWLILVII